MTVSGDQEWNLARSSRENVLLLSREKERAQSRAAPTSTAVPLRTLD